MKKILLTVMLLITYFIGRSQSFVLEMDGYNMNFNENNRTVLVDAGNSGKNAGSVHRYDNLLVKDGITIYGKLTIVETNNAVISTYFDDDRVTSGLPSRFQPTITTTAANGYVLYELEFFEVITNSKVYVSDYYLTGMDIDGNETYEIGGYSSYEVDGTCGLSITHNSGTARTKFTGISASLGGLTFENTAAFVARYNFPYTKVQFAFGNTGVIADRQFSAQFGTVGGVFTNPYTTWNPKKLIAISKTANTNNFKAGTNNKYTIKLENLGGVANNVTLTDVLPAGVTYIPNSTSVSIPAANVIETLIDHFNLTPSSYSLNNGSVLWGSNWVEANDDNNPAAGKIQIIAGELRFNVLAGAADAVRRSFDLSLAQTATLEFDYRTASMGAEILDVQLSPDGLTWTSVGAGVITGTKASTHFSYNVPNTYFTANAAIRFISASGAWVAGNISYIDNLKISYFYTKAAETRTNAPGTLNSGVPPTLLTAADNITLHPNITATLTFDISTDCNASGTVTNTATATCTEMYGGTADATHTANVDPTTIGGERCGAGNVTLTANGAQAGQDYKWYDASTGGNLLQTNGSTYTGSFPATTTYYVSFYNTTTFCESGRTPVIATISSGISGTGIITGTTAQNGTVVQTSATNPSAAVNNTAGGTVAWTNPTNVYASENTKASTNTMVAGAISNYLDISGFVLTVPSGSQIKGIEVRIERMAGTATRVYDNLIQLMNNGVPVGSDLKNATTWPNTDTYVTYGGATNTWGRTWTVSELGTIGVRIQAYRNATAGNIVASVDHVTLNVYYSAYGDDQSSINFNISGLTGATSYTWTPPTGGTIAFGQGSSSVFMDFNNAGQSGTYSVCATPSNSCTSLADICTSIRIADNANNEISGFVYYDTDGSVAPNKVDGTPIKTIAGEQLYAILVEGGVTVTNVAIKTDGSYKFSYLKNTAANYSIWLSKTPYGTGVTPSAILPSGASFNGEINNNTTNTLTGNDGSVDGKVISLTAGAESNVNFGIVMSNPIANNDAVTSNEDASVVINVASNDTDPDGNLSVSTVDLDPNTSGQQLSFSNANGDFTVDASGNVTYTPLANFNGTTSIQYNIKDLSGYQSDDATITFTVNAVNDEPSFTKGSNISACQSSVAYSESNWATSIAKGPSDESLQIVTFNVTNNNNALFDVQPAVSSSGTLTFTAASGATGSATVIINVQDNGGTANGGDNQSPDQSFTITVSSFNISIDDATIAEGNSGSSNMDFTVSLNSSCSRNVTVNYSTTNGSGTTGDNDYTSTSGTLTITAGNTSGVISVPINGDMKTESNESFTVTISSPSGGVITDDNATGTITNDDHNPLINDVIVSIDENTPNSSSVTNINDANTGNDTDSDADALTYSITAGNASGAFAINVSTGEITVADATKLDFETVTSFSLNIEVTDGPNIDDASVTININDVIEAVSFTINAISDATVNENAAYTSVTPAITGTPIGSITYSISGNDAADFSINASTGVVTMVARNFENPEDANTNNIYELTITVTDDDGNSDTEDWTVSVVDVIEAATFTINAISDATVNENSAYTSVTPAITGTPIGSINFSISGNDAADFSINASTGVVTMIARNFESPVDANTNNIYELTITATDADGNLDTEDWTVTVVDVVEAASFTIDAIANTTVNENTAYTSVTPNISGTPIGSVTYLLGGNDAADFTINATTGVVSMISRNYENPVDANTNNVYELTITATDADGNSDVEDWTVTVSDVIEVASFTINAIANTTINENTAYTSVTPAITGTPIGSLAYTLGGNDASAFTINPSTGVVNMVARDYENPADLNANNIYELTITATDADGNNDVEDWTITVLDVIEAATFTIDGISNTTINENNVYTSVTPNISGTPIGNVTYILGGNDASKFTINATSGVVSMFARDYENPVDANTNNVYELTITATDDDGNNDVEDWTVTVLNLTESTSFAIDPISNTSVNENVIYTSVTPSITGSPIGSVTYTLGGNDAARFTINATNGVVSMVARDYENPVDANTNNVYELTITATDADSNSDTEDWTVTVQDVIEAATFSIDAISNTTVNENALYTGVTPNISGTPIGNVAYTLGGNDASKFTINASTGVVSMLARDFENPVDANTNNVYELTITATDDDGNNDTEDWTVTVLDVVEVATFTIDPIANTSVNENSVYTSITPNITGTPIGTLTYTLGGTDALRFTINASTGVVSMVGRNFESSVDANTDNIYELTITATDADGNSDVEDWTVNVVDVIEAATFTIDAIANTTINENSAYTSVTPSITGTPIGSVVYTLGGNDAVKFSINASTGVVSMIARDFENPVDANTNNVYELTITVTDADNNSDVEDWTVTVLDVVEAATFTINAISDATVNENSVYTSVTPAITGTPIGSVTYSLGGNDAARFTINATTGVVSMVGRDFENPVDANTNNTYELTITATDSDGNYDAEDWIVTVLDVIEASVFTIDPIANVTVNENSIYSGITPNITGTPIGSVTYTLGGNDATDFTINATTGVVSMVARDYENPVDANTNNVYELTITVTDADGNSDLEDWTVTVLDVIEAATFTINSISNTTINENVAYTSVTPALTGTPIGSVTYSLGGNDASDFTINSSTGVVNMVARNFETPVDLNTDNVYELTITATDADGNFDVEDWTVTILDVIEISSITINPITNTSVNENDAYTSVTPAITGTPIGNLTFTLGGNDAADFTINATTGVVSMVARDFENPVDANTNNVYELTITVTDADGNFDTEDWTVTVVNLLESASFTINAISDATVNENSVYTSLTPSITGVPVGSVTYSLEGTDASKFTINSTTGVVSMVARNFENPVDANTDNVYELTIKATDTDSNYDTEDWTVTVLDVVEIATFTIDAIDNATVNENGIYSGVTPNITGSFIGSVTYSLGGVDALKFTINATTGVVSMVARDFENPVDANLDNIYELTIIATDADGNNDSEDWTVTVLDVVETVSFSIDAIPNTTINENVAYTSITPSITGSTIGSVTYSIGGTDAARFSINSSTGVVSMIGRNFENPVDANTNNVYEVTITATDTDGNFDVEDWTVTVLDAIEAATFTIDEIANTTVNENSAYTGVAPNITGAHIGGITYAISGNDASKFSINTSTGVVSMVVRNFENPEDANFNNVYELTITATDDDGNSDFEDWTVTIVDIVEATVFTINDINDVTINENSVYTSVTPAITGTIIGSLTYSLGGSDAIRFAINAATGVVSMIGRNFENPLDANANNVYELTITATDEDGNNDSEDWKVTILDVIEAATFTIDAVDNISVNENTAYTSVTPNITGSPIGNVTYALSGNDASSFTINASTGVVTMVARDFENPVDANTNNIYELTITATDEDGNSDSEDWTVTILNLSEIAIITIDPIANATVNENAAYTGVTPNITGIPSGSVTYSLSGTDAVRFTINSATGVVSMVGRNYESPVDANTDNVYELAITASDADGNFDTEDWTVTVIDVIEAASFTIDEIVNTTVVENNTYTSVTPNITGTHINGITYSLGGNDAALFTINATTGVVKMVARDFENPVDANTNNVYELTITATDSDENSDTEDWTITVLDEIEAASFSIEAIADATINENSLYTSVTPSITGATIGTLIYTLGGVDVLRFTINSTTGVVSMIGRNYENPADANIDNVYELNIIATDADGNSDTEDWTVTVIDAIEAATFTLDNISDVTINENTSYTSITPNITGVPIGNLTYSLGGNDAADFTINPVTGIVSMIARDYENPEDANTNNVYEITITATDDDGNSDFEEWTVTILDEVESTVFNINAISDATINENIVYTSITPSITGSPIGSLTYTLGGADALRFTINATTGVVSMVGRNFENPVDADVDNVYVLTIIATDSNGNSDSEAWTVTVFDVIEAATFTVDAIDNVTINENTAYISITPNITGTPIANITYSISGNDAADFTINSVTGVVSMIARDFENPEDANLNNVYELTITARDDDGNSDSEDWTVTILNANDIAPIAANDAATTNEDGSVIVNVLGNDSGLSDGGITVSIATGPTHGTAIVNGDGTLTYTPNSDFNGTETFEYQVCDADGDCQTATVTITVNAVDDVPVTQNDVVSVNEDGNTTINILGNDSGLGDGGITISIPTDPTHGTVVINGDGTITYTPNPDFNGTDTFTYQVCDSDGDCQTATVAVTVISVNDSPVTSTDAVTVVEDGITTINILGNDTGLGDGGITITIPTDPTHGTIVINGDGTLTYTPDSDFNGTDTFEYRVCDSDGDCQTTTVTVTITSVDDVPLVVNDVAITNEDGGVIVSVLGNDSGLGDGGIILTIPTSPTHGTVVINGDETITYTPGADYNGTDTFEYQVCDADGDCQTATVTITINSINDSPIAYDDSYTFNLGSEYSVSANLGLLSNDTDLDNNPLTAIKVTDPANGTVIFNTDGSFTYTANNAFVTNDSFTYKANDGSVDGNTATVTITIVDPSIDHLPISIDDNAITNQNQAVTVSVLTNDTGLEDAPVTVSIVTNGAHGSAVVNTNNSITYTPATDYFGADQITYKVTDLDGDEATANVTITVNQVVVDHLPVAVNDNAITNQNQAVTVSVLTNDIGLEDAPVTVSIVTNGAHGNAIVNADNSITFTPATDYFGADQITYKVTDLDGDEATANVTITVNQVVVDHLPVAVNDNAITKQNQAVTVSVLTNDTGLEDAPVTVSIVTNGAHGNAIVNADNSITFTPATDYFGADQITYKVTDLDGDEATANVTITVNQVVVDHLPVAVNDNVITNQNQAVTVSVLTNDTGLEDAPVVVTLVTNGAHGNAMVNADNSITFTPATDYFGADQITYKVTDLDGDFAITNITITINQVIDHLPIAVDDIAKTSKDKEVVINVLSNDTGLEDGSVIVTILSQPSNGSVIINSNNIISYTPAFGFKGADMFTYRVCDADGDYASANVSITITEEIEIPEGFSPNGDGTGDTFVIIGIENFSENELIVFNRWGTEVYRKKNYNNEWDGHSSSNGKLPVGTYFFVLTVKGKSTPFKGYIYLKY